MPLDQEWQFFQAHRQEFLKEHEGEFALIKGDEVSFHDSDNGAYAAALDRYGDVDVFIKQVLAEDPVEDSPALIYGLLHVEA